MLPLEPFADKYRAFNWHVIEVDGHDVKEFIDATEAAKSVSDKPTVIIAHTIPGKGVPEIEKDFHWHGKPPSAEEGKKFLEELRSMKGKIEASHHA